MLCVFFGLVSFCEMMLLMMISCVNSILAVFYYGNITYPSHDPPKMGFLSTVPQDAALQLVSAVATVETGNNLPCRSLLLSSLAPFFYPPPPYSSIGSGTKRDGDEVFVWIEEQCVADKRVVGVVGVFQLCS